MTVTFKDDNRVTVASKDDTHVTVNVKDDNQYVTVTSKDRVTVASKGGTGQVTTTEDRSATLVQLDGLYYSLQRRLPRLVRRPKGVHYSVSTGCLSGFCCTKEEGLFLFSG